MIKTAPIIPKEQSVKIVIINMVLIAFVFEFGKIKMYSNKDEIQA